MRRTMLAAMLLALVATACGSDIEAGDYADESAAPSASPTETLPPCPASAVTVSADTAKNLTKKPRLVMKTQGCSPSATLQKTDLVVGTGAVVKATDTVTAHYVGVGFNTRKEFDSSWKGGQPAEFPLDGVIKGWTQGIPGMKVGGRRLLVIPGDLAYGAQPPSADIQPNEALIFVVDIKAAKPKS